MLKNFALSAMLAFTCITFAPAQARETKTVILLEAGDAPPIFLRSSRDHDRNSTQELRERLGIWIKGPSRSGGRGDET
jgi:hypothetical protein